MSQHEYIPVHLSFSERMMQHLVQHYNPEKYWRFRAYVVDPTKRNFFGRLKAKYYLFRIKRMDAFNNATTGTHIGYGAQFKSVPILSHGLNGIVISHHAKIGKNCIINHRVTIGEGNNGAPTIGDNVMIGTGANIIGGITIGNNVKIGAGCIVTKDVPDNATVVMDHPRIIIKAMNKAISSNINN